MSSTFSELSLSLAGRFTVAVSVRSRFLFVADPADIARFLSAVFGVDGLDVRPRLFAEAPEVRSEIGFGIADVVLGVPGRLAVRAL